MEKKIRDQKTKLYIPKNKEKTIKQILEVGFKLYDTHRMEFYDDTDMELYVFKKKNYEYDLEYIKGNNKLLMYMLNEKKTYHVNNNLKYPLKGAIIYLYAGTRMLIPDGLGITRVNICVLEKHKNIFKHESRIGKFRYNVNYNHKSLNEIIKKIEKGKCDSFVAKADDVIDFLDKGSSWSLVK